MKVAIISVKPASLASGAEVRNYYLMKGLKQDHKVNFYLPTLSDELPTANLKKRIVHLLHGEVPYIEYLRNGTISKKEIEEIKKADIIQLEELETYFVIEKYLQEFTAPVVLDAHNIEYKKFLSDLESQNSINKFIGNFLANKIKHLELDSLNKVDYLITCSPVDQIYFSKYLDKKKIVYIPNGVDCNFIKATPLPKSNKVLFMGLLSYGPNEDGIKFYIENIHSKVKTLIEGYELVIIGRNPPKWLSNISKTDKSIVLKGFVEDVRAALYDSTVCICPIRSGSGTRLKVLEYMSAGRPVVSTTIGSEGIIAQDNQEILIADSINIFTQKIVNLLTDHELAKKIGLNSRKLMEEKYHWDKITKNLKEFYTNIL